MNITSYATADQVIPISKARANLSSLIDEVSEYDFFILSRKYRPEVALVDLDFLSNLLEIYKKWQREQDFARLAEIQKDIPQYDPEEIEQDIADAIKAVRKNKNRS